MVKRARNHWLRHLQVEEALAWLRKRRAPSRQLNSQLSRPSPNQPQLSNLRRRTISLIFSEALLQRHSKCNSNSNSNRTPALAS